MCSDGNASNPDSRVGSGDWNHRVQKATASASVIHIDATNPETRTQSPLADCELLANIEGRGELVRATILIDSGAEVNLIKPDVAHKLVSLGAKMEPTTLGYYGVDGTTRHAHGTVVTYLRIARQGVPLQIKVEWLVDDFSGREQAILGWPTAKKSKLNEMLLDASAWTLWHTASELAPEEVELYEKTAYLDITDTPYVALTSSEPTLTSSEGEVEPDWGDNIALCRRAIEEEAEDHGELFSEQNQPVDRAELEPLEQRLGAQIATDASPGMRKDLVELGMKYAEVFDERLDPRGVEGVKDMIIELKDQADLESLTGYHHRKYSPAQTDFLVSKVRSLESNGLIVPTDSAIDSPVVIAKKSNGDFRLCIDYRKLNDITLRINYPMRISKRS